MKTFDEAALEKATHIAQTLVNKQKDYGKENILRCPVGAEMGLIVRLSDKLNRLANLYQSGKEPTNETLQDTWLDCAGYSLIGMMLTDNTFKLPMEEDAR